MKTNLFKLLVFPVFFAIIFSCEQEDKDAKAVANLSAVNQTISVKPSCSECSYNTSNLTSEERQELAEKFAPQLRFDRAARTFPMSAELIYQNSSNTGCNNDRIAATLSDAHFDMNLNETESKNPIYTYYTTIRQENYLYVAYWWAYYRQPNCFRNAGGHDYDWEHITVKVDFTNQTVDDANIVSLRYAEHSEYKIYNTSQVSFVNQTHPVVYVGKLAHPSYNSIRRSRIICASDYSNPRGSQDYFDTAYKGAERLQEMRCDKVWSASKSKWGKIGENPLYRTYDIW